MEDTQAWCHWPLFALSGIKVNKKTLIIPLLRNCTKLTRVFICFNSNMITTKSHLTQDRSTSMFMSLGVNSSTVSACSLSGEEKGKPLTCGQFHKSIRRRGSGISFQGMGEIYTASFSTQNHGITPTTYTFTASLSQDGWSLERSSQWQVTWLSWSWCCHLFNGNKINRNSCPWTFIIRSQELVLQNEQSCMNIAKIKLLRC